MTRKKRTIIGRIINRTSRQGVPGLRVEAWDKDILSSDDKLGEAVSDENGFFRIEFSEDKYKGLFDGNPDLYFEVYHKYARILSTEDSIFWDEESEKTEIVLEVDLPAEVPSEQTFKVSGLVCQKDRRPCVDTSVRAWHKGLRSEKLLGESRTDAKGQYAINYQVEKLGMDVERCANLLVRAYDASNSPIAVSPVRFHAKRSETVNLVVDDEGSAASLYQRLVKKITPLLDGAVLTELSKEDRDFLSRESGIPAAEVARVVMAERAAKLTGFPAEAFHASFSTGTGNNRGTDSDFWQGLAGDFNIAADQVTTFRFMSQVGEMVSFEHSLLQPLQALLAKEEIFGPLDLALWDITQWRSFLDEAWKDDEVLLPSWAAGKKRVERLRSAASWIVNQAARIFPPKKSSALLVSGHIETVNKRPAADVRVQVCHHDFDKEIPISPRVCLDDEGKYRIALDPVILMKRVPSLRRFPLMLQLVVWSDQDDQPVGRSEIRANIKLPVTLDLTLDREVGPTEFELIKDRIDKVLGKISPESLGPEKLKWIAEVTAIDPETIQRYVISCRQAKGEVFPAEALYGLLHPAVDERDTPKNQSIKKRLQRAIDKGLVAEGVLEYIESLEAWHEKNNAEKQQLEIEARIAQLRKPTPEGRPGGPVDFLRVAGVQEATLERFIRIAAEHPNEDNLTLESRLIEDGIPVEEQAVVNMTMRISELVGPRIFLIKRLMQDLKKALPSTIGEDETKEAIETLVEPVLSSLARKNVLEWVELLQAAEPGRPTDELSPQAFLIEQQFERSYPTEALLGRLIERLGGQTPTGTSGAEPAAKKKLQEIKETLETIPAIEIHGKGLKFQNIDGLKESVVTNLESLQRLSRVASCRDAISLFESGYRSARDIAATAASEFEDDFLATVKKKSSGASNRNEKELRKQAANIHRQATGQAAAAVAIGTLLLPSQWRIDPAAICGSGDQSGWDDNSTATLEKLFGAFDACSVVPCESVLGLPAYLVDLLELLDRAGGEKKIVREALEQRRPDIFHLELSCANAETLLPYIDLVIELLEDIVAGTRRIPEGQYGTSEDLKLTPVLSKKLLASKAPEALLDSNVYRQTSWASDELMAYPEHMNPVAYEKLASQETLFPWSLPFSLPHEEAYTYLGELGTSHAELMARLRPGKQALEQASARIGLNPIARKVTQGLIPATQPWRYWGYSTANAPHGWPDCAGANVKELLARTGLSYADLLEFLNAEFINPDGTVVLQFADGASACDLGSARLENADEFFLDRFHRFVRLWMRLGCSIREMDRAIKVLGNSQINDDFLVALAEALEICKRLKMPLAEILPFWGDLDTRASLDRSTEPFKRQSSQYETILLDKSKLSASERKRLAWPFEPGTQISSLVQPAATALGIKTKDVNLLLNPNADLLLHNQAISDTEPLGFVSALYRWQTLSRALALTITDLLRLQACSGLDLFSSPMVTRQFLDIIDEIQCHNLSIDEFDFVIRHISSKERLHRFREEGRKLHKRVKQALGAIFTLENAGECLCREAAQVCRLPISALTAIFNEIQENTSGDDLLEQVAEWLQLEPDAQEVVENDREINGMTQDNSGWHAYVRLIKSARLYAKMNVSDPLLLMVSNTLHSPLKIMPPSSLPSKGNMALGASECRELFAKWRSLHELMRVQRHFANKHRTLWQTHEALASGAGSDSNVQSWQKVASELGKTELDVETLISAQLLDITTTAQEAGPSTWLQFLDAALLAEQLGVSVVSLQRWVADELGLDVSAEMRTAVAMKQGAEKWSIKAPLLRNSLRIKQREALLAFVRVKQDMSVDDLQARYLIDLEMGPDQLTSRIALATATVQRYVQRALLGYEKTVDGNHVTLPESFSLTWEWMKNYDSWVRARKVFLFPENFLSPEIRDDKSPFFVELEQQLSQRALGEESIEEAIGQYLQKLDEVARLEIMGSCFEGGGSRKLMHIIGRTRSVPHDYYHRVWHMGGGGFTPWTKLDLGIEGDWLIPVILKGRLNLYWIKHTRQIEAMADMVGLVPSRPFPLMPHYPMFQDQYSLSWCTRQRKGWSKKQMSPRPITRTFNPLLPAEFSVRLDPDRLRIAGVTPLPQLPRIGSLLPGIRQAKLFEEAGENFGGFLGGLVGGEEGRARGRNTGGAVGRAFDDLISPDNNDDPANDNDPANNAISGFFEGMDALATLQSILAELANLQTIIDKLGSLPQEVWQEFSRKLQELPREVWAQFESMLGELGDTAWGLLPDDIRNILSFLRQQIDKVIDFLTPLGAVPERITGHMLAAGVKFVSNIAAVFKELLDGLFQAGLSSILPQELVVAIKIFFSTVVDKRPSWSGPELAFEFGFFDVTEGNTRALRLSPPPMIGVAVATALLGAGAAGAGVAGTVALPALFSPFGMALLPGLIALNETARLLYSMFPGYPAFHDLPVRSGALSTELPIGTGMQNDDWRIRAWPGNGFLFLPRDMVRISGGSCCALAIRLDKIVKEEWNEINSPLSNENLRAFLIDSARLVDGITDKVDEALSLLNVGMRVVRPLPFDTYPGRLNNPSPIIIGEERHGRNFLISPLPCNLKLKTGRIWNVLSFYHPLTNTLNSAFDRDGIQGLYASGSSPGGGAWKHGGKIRSQTVFQDTFWVEKKENIHDGPASYERLDLTQDGAYSLYNWELFFHIPMLIAGRLARQQSFSRALDWYRKVFDPTVSTGNSPQRFWRFKKFYDDYKYDQPYQSVLKWLTELSEGSPNDEHEHIVAAWKREPFNPHRVARMRVGSYARWVVIRTVENLIDWGDARFREESWEAVNEATQLYLLAREILGERPHLVPARHRQALTYRQLADAQGAQSGGIDSFGNAILTIESALSPLTYLEGDESVVDPSMTLLSGKSFLYFGIPANERLLGFWDIIEDRLYKIRHSQDFSGRRRALLPFALGQEKIVSKSLQHTTQDSSRTQSNSTAGLLPPYRFQFMQQKAYEFAGEVRAFGAALLSAAEKRDAEELARLRSGHEVTLLEAMRHIRELQIDEALYALESARQGKEGAKIRQEYYSSRLFMNPAESAKENLMALSLGFNVAATVSDAVAAIAHAWPQNKVEGSGGTDTSAKAATEFGGQQFGLGASATARVFSALSSLAQGSSSMAGSYAGYERRQEEWDHQANLAENDLLQFEEQISGAKARLEIAQRELENHDKQLANAKEIATYMQEKFSNEELYEWMLGQAAQLHFQSYLLAVDGARQAERCFQFESLPLDTLFISCLQWDDLAGGLMAGERLQHDLRRMERSYLEQNTREYELTKHISLSTIDPEALLRLRETGQCFVNLTENLFDADHPGHYLRRIKNVSLSIPCVVGPYSGVNCKLSLVRSAIRINSDLQDGYKVLLDDDNPRFENDSRFVEVNSNDVPEGRFVLSSETTSMVTSTGQNDAGLFEMNLRDERYLPFEGAGVISSWRIELHKETNRFDPTTIADVVIHLRYTARDGGRSLCDAAWEAVFNTSPPQNTTLPRVEDLVTSNKVAHLFSAKKDFSEAWNRWLHPIQAQSNAVLDLDLSRERFPYYPPELRIVLQELRFVFVTEPEASAEGIVAKLHFVRGDGRERIMATTVSRDASFTVDDNFASLVTCNYTPGVGSGTGQWKFEIAAEDNDQDGVGILKTDTATNSLTLAHEKIRDLFVLCSYVLE